MKKAFDKPMNRLRSITGQYPLEKNKNHAKKKKIYPQRQASAIDTSYSFLGIKSIYVLWIENIVSMNGLAFISKPKVIYRSKKCGYHM